MRYTTRRRVLRRFWGQDRSGHAGIAPETFVRCLHSAPSARTTSDFGAPAGKKRASSPPLQELGIEYQLQLARCFRLGLPVLGLKEFGIGDKLRIARASVRSVRRRPRTGVGAERAFPQPAVVEDSRWDILLAHRPGSAR